MIVINMITLRNIARQAPQSVKVTILIATVWKGKAVKKVTVFTHCISLKGKEESGDFSINWPTPWLQTLYTEWERVNICDCLRTIASMGGVGKGSMEVGALVLTMCCHKEDIIQWQRGKIWPHCVLKGHSESIHPTRRTERDGAERSALLIDGIESNIHVRVTSAVQTHLQPHR